MKPLRVLVALLTLGASSFGWWSCSSDPSSEPAKSDAGGAAGGATGGTTSGGGAGAGGYGGSGGAGSGGTGNSAGIDWGPPPKWEATNIVAANCPIERLANASEIKMFVWKPCDWAPNDCEEAVFNSAATGTNPVLAPNTTVHDDGANVRLGLEIVSPKSRALFATDSGTGLAGFRPVSDCLISSASVWNERFAVAVGQGGLGGELGGIVGVLGSATQAPGGFTVTTKPAGLPGNYPLGSARWFWWWSPTYALTSLSAADGSDYKLVATTAPPSELVYLGQPVATGKTFLFEAFVGDDAGLAHGKILYSDGVSAPQVYAEPADPNSHYGRPIFANNLVAFFKGLTLQDINKYASVELWVSPFSEDPVGLAPAKLSNMPYKTMPSWRAGGWGFAAMGGSTTSEPVWIWNLATGANVTRALGSGYNLKGFSGVTRTHVWVNACLAGLTECFLIRMRHD